MTSSLFEDVEAGATAVNEKTPLLSAKNGTANGQHDVIQALPLHTWQEMLLKALAASSVVLYIASAFCSNGGSILKICNILGIWLCYAALENQKEIMDIQELKEVNEAYGKELTSYQEENVKLSKKLKELEQTSQKLEEVQNTLEMLHSKSGDNADKLFSQVKKNEQILKANRNSMRTLKLQNAMAVIMSTDTDGDMKIDKNEESSLRKSLGSVYDLEISEDDFSKFLDRRNRSITALMHFVKTSFEEKEISSKNIREIFNS
mmetsp:Transcript_8248/g.12209  ORF Transcript_8248/g.12209 Transcript_8248/m.12209 type:complete len:262 (-) Transcript_8248:208-993(-)